MTFSHRTQIPEKASLPAIWLHFKDGTFDYVKTFKKQTDFIVVEEASVMASTHVDDESPVTSFSYLVDKLLGGE